MNGTKPVGLIGHPGNVRVPHTADAGVFGPAPPERYVDRTAGRAPPATPSSSWEATMWLGLPMGRLSGSVRAAGSRRRPALGRPGTHRRPNSPSRLAVEALEGRNLLSSATPVPTALDAYVSAPDPSYQYALNKIITGAGYTDYVIDLTSQTWRSPSEVDRTLW